MQIFKTPLFISLFVLMLTGCASIHYQPVNDKDDGDGIRYYNSSPYLLVYSNGKGGLVTQLLYIADPSKKMEAKPKNFLSTAQTTMEFEKGVFRSGKTTADATGVPTAIIAAIKTAGPALIAANDPAKDRSVPAPYLYKIIVEGSTVTFKGDKGDIRVNVNILEQKEEKKTK